MACAIAWRYDRLGETIRTIRNVHADDGRGQFALRGWRGQLALRYERRAERTVLAERRHAGPMLVQKALYPEGEDICHNIVLHPPGGIVGGDELELEARLLPQSSVLLTTPGATKWYRSTGAQARQCIRFEVGYNASLEWLPQPAIVFDHASGHSEVEVAVDASGCYIGWEMLCLGRTASGERFRAGSMILSTRVRRGNDPLWVERAAIRGGSRLLTSPVGLAGEPVSGTLVAVSSRIDAALITACRAVEPITGRGGITRLPGLLLARYLGERSEAGHDYFVRLWRVLRPALLGREAQIPRIWRT